MNLEQTWSTEKNCETFLCVQIMDLAIFPGAPKNIVQYSTCVALDFKVE